MPFPFVQTADEVLNVFPGHLFHGIAPAFEQALSSNSIPYTSALALHD
jgi:hypothetical protein